MNEAYDSLAALVITAPKPYEKEFAYGTGARQTLGVLTELFTGARKRVVIAAPFVQAEPVFEIGVLSVAIRSALSRGVAVDIMTTKENFSGPIFQELANAWKERVRLFYPAFPSSDMSSLGSHAKFCISDGKAAYVGSANLTGPGVGGLRASSGDSPQHFEMGLLVEGAIASQLEAFWNYSVRFGIFAQIA